MNKKGYILNAYGIIDFLNIDDDFNIEKLKSEPITKEKEDILYLPSEVELLSSSNLRFRIKDKVGINIDFESITNWRFKSEVDISNDSWSSKNIFYQ